VALTSLLVKLGPNRDATVVVMDGGLRPGTRARLTAAIRRARPATTLHFVAPDLAAFSGGNFGSWHSPAMFMRLLIADFMPPDVRRVLYIDADVAVTEDVGPLFDADTKNLPIWAVIDAGSDKEQPRLERAFPSVAFAPGATYFNSGVMLIDLPAWRRERITERALDLVRREGDRLVWGDQDVLNVLMAGRWGALAQKWNNQIHGGDAVFPELFATGSPRGILHWAGPAKPWHPARPSIARDIYLAELARARMVSRESHLRLKLLSLIHDALHPLKRMRRNMRKRLRRA
jgi:UDP-D-galactose:(glucosyl)LPS alpha-1,3-D-galactosyltransferase